MPKTIEQVKEYIIEEIKRRKQIKKQFSTYEDTWKAQHSIIYAYELALYFIDREEKP